ncbi:LPS export ABC transporter periplasmic protein LptC, partial [Psittacicella gerlachiana]
MLIQKRVIFVLCLLAVAIGIYSLSSRDDDNASQVNKSDLPQMEISKAILTSFDPLGNNEYTVISNQVDKLQESDIFNFTNVLVYSIRKDQINQSVFMVTNTATMENKNLLFKDNVEVFSLGNPNFQRAELSDSILNLDSYILSSNNPITIYGQSFITKADGFKFNIKEGKYNLDGNV